MSDTSTPKHPYALHIDEIRSILKRWIIPAIFAIAILATTIGLWWFDYTEGRPTQERIAEGFLLAEIVAVFILIVLFIIQAFQLHFSREDLVSTCLKRLRELNHSRPILKALKDEAEIERTDGQNWTLLPFFILSLLLAGSATISQMRIASGGTWILVGLVVFFGVTQNLSETSAASILARALIRYDLDTLNVEAPPPSANNQTENAGQSDII